MWRKHFHTAAFVPIRMIPRGNQGSAFGGREATGQPKSGSTPEWLVPEAELAEQQERPDEEPRLGGAAETIPAPKGRQALSLVRRALTEKELMSPGAIRQVLGDLDRLESECGALNDYRDKFHAADKRAAILEKRVESLEEKIEIQSKRSVSADILFGGCLALGTLIMGYVPWLLGQQLPGWPPFLIGCILIVMGVAARVVRK